MSESQGTPDYRALMIDALRKIDNLQAQLQAAKNDLHEPIAIIGMGCRFPGGSSGIDAYLHTLRSGRDAIVPIPPGRWDVGHYYDPEPQQAGKMYVREGGFLDAIEDFDAEFFDISPREAMGMDPQQRLWLEVCWEALEHAHIIPADLYGTQTGVFVGASGFDFAAVMAKHLKPEQVDGYLGTGASLNMLAGRLSYYLGLTGPSLAIDTACSSSLVAVHSACQSLRLQECQLALAGGVNVLLAPETYIAFSQANMLSGAARCQAFADNADGLIRSEGAGVVVLKRLADALGDGDRIIAVIRGSAVNQDGASGGLTVPSGPSQQAVIRSALAAAGVRPEQIGYIEAHGTGTPLGDPIEFGALAASYGRGDADKPVYLASVKTNLGHLEAASGIAGLIKAALSVCHGEIFPHLHFKSPSRHIDWQSWAVKIPVTAEPWPDLQRLAAVSSFGLSGTNAHLIVEQPPQALCPQVLPPGGTQILQLSAKSRQALQQLAASYAEQLFSKADANIAGICAAANTSRSRFKHELNLRADTAAAFKSQLEQFALTGLMPQIPAGYASGIISSDVLQVRDSAHAIYQRQTCVDLPTYPWCKQRHWPDWFNAKPAALAEKPRFSGKQLATSAWAAEVTVFELELDSDTWPWLCEHQVYGMAVAPVALFIAVIYDALSRCYAGQAFGLQDVEIERALLLPEHDAVTLQCVLRQDAQGVVAQVFGKEQKSGAWLLHVSGVVELHALPFTGMAWPGLPGDGFGHMNGAAFYDAYAEHGLVYGEAFQRIQQLWQGEGKAVAELAALADTETSATPHPLMLDALLQTLGAVIARDGVNAANLPGAGVAIARDGVNAANLPGAGAAIARDGVNADLRLPTRIKYIRFYASDFSACRWACAEMDGDLQAGLMLYDADHRALIGLHGVELSPIGKTQLQRLLMPVADYFYTPVWRSQPLTRTRPLTSWLVLSLGAEADLIPQLQARGDRVVLVGELADTDLSGIDVVLDLRPLSWTVTDTPGLPQWLADCGRLLSTLNQLQGAAPQLTIVTRAVHADTGAQANLAGAALWGMAAVICHEHAELQPRIIDVADAGQLLPVLLDQSAEQRWLGRQDGWYVQRLGRYRPKAGAAPDLVADASYLITGGLGALGVVTARWLAGRGARHLVISTRQAGADLPEELAALQPQVDITVMQADVSDVRQLEALLASIDGTGHPLRGIVHCAGYSDDGLLLDQTVQRFENVAGPKLLAAVHLDRLTRNKQVDFFLLYSSLTALLGSAGQGAYAAANAAMDAVALQRRRAGYTATTINWGPWDSGLRSDAMRGLWQQAGIGLIDEARGIAALDQILDDAVAQLCVVDADWRKVGGQSASVIPSLLKEQIADVAGVKNASPGNEVLAALHHADSRQRRALLETWLCRQLAATLKRDVATTHLGTAFSSLGLDSLAAVELRSVIRKQLAVDVPVSQLLQSDGRALSAFLEQAVISPLQQRPKQVLDVLADEDMIEGEL
ncbi:MAG: SDR family NAD(P)-dependent oxidoreductase [Aquabacterium sp.]|uniref:SDR family NAD(P)-dependent oxidoreductase n=1 Tax=Aquabacterium sp. TaxID=1872578 RepID=UPI002722F78C|nr:SDR family NAD(P)-dependent oxidoreductase [Aquabacterium sp.]MDO9003896.1 SDR family NAD(P)-dependent oxidoreductase [Aquabacterium sp.]